MIDRLLAKSWNSTGTPPPDSVFLPGHLRDVYSAASQVLKCTAVEQLESLGLSACEWGERFRRIVLLAAALHDLGKANDHFQEAVRGLRTWAQGMRHEWVLLVLLQQQSWRNWLLPAVAGRDEDFEIATWCIAGHHPKYGRPSPPAPATIGGDTEIRVFADHSDFQQALNWLREQFNLGPLPFPTRSVFPLTGYDDVFGEVNTWFRKAIRVWTGWQTHNEALCRLVAAAKACMVAADVAGSALPTYQRQGLHATRWILGSFDRRPSPQDLTSLVAGRLNCDSQSVPSKLRAFQREVADKAGRVTFVRAGCGTGKTLAAFNWAATIPACRHRRLYLCYPTTGTATEGYRDYLLDADAGLGKYGADLFHGRRDIDLESLRVDGDEELSIDDPPEDAWTRVDSLEAWSTPIVSCTVDIVLSLVQNHRKALYTWPALTQSVFVFDEIHSYDERLFGALLCFIEVMRGVPILLMTASLPAARLQAIKSCLERQGEALVEVSGPKEIEHLPRYSKSILTDPTNLLCQVQQEIDEEGKVLWVCNTVNRAMAAAKMTEALQPILYHSRFRYEDRVQQHRRIIGAFRAQKPALAICTQVAEMSLDLSATLLVTDLAPVPAMIQRLGRLNRHACQGDPVRSFIVLEPMGKQGTMMALPYDEASLEVARRWLNMLPDTDISQEHLVSAWDELGEMKEPQQGYKHSTWCEGGPATNVIELRKGSPGITVVLQEDIPALRSGQKRLTEVALPMPPPFKECAWQDGSYRGIPVAARNSVIYDSQRGAQWRRHG